MRKTWTLVFDLVGVVIFVAAGRRTHGSENTIGEVVETAAPFVIGLAIGWLAMRAWQNPTALRTGYGVLASTLVVGMLLRRLVWGDGTAVTFIAVAAGVLTVLVLGWRIAIAVAGRSGPDEGVSD